MTTPAGITWTVQQVTKITDGDSVRLIRRRQLVASDGIGLDLYDLTDVPIRLVTLDTPERGQDGWAQARLDLTLWIAPRAGFLNVVTYGETGGFSRLLGDIFDTRDQTSASEHMLRLGWPPYVRGE